MSELLQKIASGEGVCLDFKFRIDDQSKIARTLCAFSNTEGGSLLIGVKDNGKVAGCVPEEEFYMIQGAADIACKPAVLFETKVWQEKHHFVLEVIVRKGDGRIKCKDENGKWVPFYRIKDRTLRANNVLDKLWSLKRSESKRPEKFSDHEIEVIKTVNEFGPISLTKLNRMTELGFTALSNLLATLIHWRVIDFHVDDDGLRYYCSEYQD
jgi:predicted HTH transcriptional regulator